MATNYVDLTGIVSAQQTWLDDLKNRPVSDTTVAASLTGLQQQLGNLYGSFKDSTGTSAAVLDHQTEMDNIVKTEKQRLDNKKQLVDQALESQHRALQLNDSYRQKYLYYTRIIMFIVLFLIVYIVLNAISKSLPFVPSFVFDILYFFLFLTLVFVIYFVYLDIVWRDNMNFNELGFIPPHTDSPEEIQAKIAQSSKIGDLLGTLNVVGCVGQSCCNPKYTKWDPASAMCTAIDAQGFTTMNIEYNGQIILPNSPNEFDSYSKV
jgi:hypothetical protein